MSCTATQTCYLCSWLEDCVRWGGWWIPPLALEVRHGFIFLGRPLSKNILCSNPSLHQVLARQWLLAAQGEL